MDDFIYDVCIVGAGASGLEALKQLHEYNNDYRVCIIEGRDRIGIINAINDTKHKLTLLH